MSHTDLSRGKAAWKSRGAGVFCSSFPFQSPPCYRARTLLLAASLGSPACLFSLWPATACSLGVPAPFSSLTWLGLFVSQGLCTCRDFCLPCPSLFTWVLLSHL